MNRRRPLIVCAITVCCFVALSGSALNAQTMTMSPHKIVINAVGQAEDLQAVINMSLAAGYRLTDYEVTLSLDDQEVIEAQSFRYCYIDDNFLAGFNRQDVLNSPVVHALVGQTVVAKVAGWYVGTAADGSTQTFTFEAYDDVEIVGPGKFMR